MCHCRAVTDSHVLQAIAAGAEDETDIARLCGAGTGCGSCHDELRRLCEASRLGVGSATERRLVSAAG